MKRFCKNLAFGLVALIVLAWVSQAHADFSTAKIPGPEDLTPEVCNASQWDWTLDVTKNEVGDNRCAPDAKHKFWLIVPKSPAGKAGKPKKLTFDFQHLVAVPGHGNEVAPNPAAPLSVEAGKFKAGDFRAGAMVIDHHNTDRAKKDHRDLYYWQVVISPGGGAKDGVPEITANAHHVAAPVAEAGWSFTFGKDRDGQPIEGLISVEASYPGGKTKQVERKNPKKKVNHDNGRLPNLVIKKKNGKKKVIEPTDYKVTGTLGDPFSTDLTLAYIVADGLGGFTEADLAIMNEFFVGDGKYFVPMLFDVDETQDLFIGVDLLQWLSFPTSFSMGDTYSFTGGVSDLLPGFFAATSLVTFDPVAGRFTSEHPLNGPGIALGKVDGGNVPVPEPSTALVFGAGLLGLLYADWRRRKRAA